VVIDTDINKLKGSRMEKFMVELNEVKKFKKITGGAMSQTPDGKVEVIIKGVTDGDEEQFKTFLFANFDVAGEFNKIVANLAESE
jgi:acylphosphatase